jgi:uncharacterized OB-fold protein
MTSAALPAPSPTPTVDTAPFWEALTRDTFLLLRCTACATHIWYPRKFCPACHSTEADWVTASGRGRIYSFTVVHRSALPGWAGSTPYVIAYVELDEGPRVLTNVVNGDPEALAIGDPVRVVYSSADEGSALFRFEPAN